MSCLLTGCIPLPAPLPPLCHELTNGRTNVAPVFDYDSLTSDDFLCSVSVPIDTLKNGKTESFMLKLHDEEREEAGYVVGCSER